MAAWVFEWSWNAKPTFQLIFGERKALLQLEKETKLALARDSALSWSTKVKNVGIHYAGQERYGSYSSGIHRKRTKSPEQNKSSLDIAGCFKCNGPDNISVNFPRPPNIARAGARRLEYSQKIQNEAWECCPRSSSRLVSSTNFRISSGGFRRRKLGLLKLSAHIP